MLHLNRIAVILIVALVLSDLAGVNISAEMWPAPDLSVKDSPAAMHREMARFKAKALDKQREIQRAEALLQAPYQTNCDIVYYDVEIRVNDTTEFLYGVVRVVGLATEDNVDRIDLNFDHTMTTDSAVGPSGLLSISHPDVMLYVTLDRVYNTGEQFDFSVYYHGHPVEGGFQSFAFGTRDDHTIISSLSEPYGARTWWPCKDRMDDKPDSMGIAIEVDTLFYVGSNGTLDSTIYHGDNTHTFYYSVGYPIVTYLFSVAISDYTVWEDEWVYNNDADTMPLVYAVYPDLYNTSLTGWAVIPQALTVYSDVFGPYPFATEKYGHSHFQWGGCMEHQTMSSMAGSWFGFWEPVVVHELSHQWWGNMITCESWADIWLNEGWASYSEAWYYLETEGWTSYHNYMNGMAYTGGGTVYCDDTTSVSRIFHGGLSYDKGAWVVHMLRGVLGEAKFADAVSAYYNSQYQHGAATTAEFHELVEIATGVELDWFFEDWIYGEYRPNYHWAYWTGPVDGGGYEVYLHVGQTQTSQPQVFRTPVDFVFGFASAPDDTVTLDLGERSKLLHLTFPDEVTSVQLDPIDWVLKYETMEPWVLTIVTTDDDLNDGARAAAYLDTVEARGGSGDFTFSLSDGTLPVGITLSGDGVISGMPDDSGHYAFSVRVDDDVLTESHEASFELNIAWAFTGVSGDANDDGDRNISDITYLVNHLFGIPLGAPPPSLNQGDANGSCEINVSDIIYLIEYLFGIPTGPLPVPGCVE